KDIERIRSEVDQHKGVLNIEVRFY
ncbi:uncharacterized protein METZ01_LOCUS487696, partial [marine metagenome]